MFKSFDDFLSYFNISTLKSSDFFKIAMTHSSYDKFSFVAGKKINQRCEFFGDAILGFLVCEILYFLFPDEEDGFLAKKKSLLVSREIAAKAGRDIFLNQEIKSSEILKNDNNSILSCFFEAMICCIYMQYGLEKAKEIVNIIIVEKYLNEGVDPKTKLQEFCQEKYKLLPTYELISVQGDDHEPIFEIKIKVINFVAFGSGRTKKIAQKNAALEMLSILGI